MTVVDSGLRPVDQGSDPRNVDLDPGIYRVRAVIGDMTREEYRVLRQGAVETIEFQLQQLQHRSIAPLYNTHDLVTEHAVIARKHSHDPPDAQIGRGGGRLFIMSRGHHSPGADPATGLLLLYPDGRTAVDLSKVGRRNTNEEYPWATCNLDIEPSTYLLHIDIDPPVDGRRQLEGRAPVALTQSIVVSPTWQTQVFLPQQRYGKKDGPRRADLVGAVIFMSQAGFDPDSPHARSDDLARLMLSGRIAVSQGNLDRLFQGEFQNPMLGIYGGHLLCRAAEIDRASLNGVVQHLRGALVLPHPDVEALALVLNDTPRIDFAVPPMLQSSWSVVLEHHPRMPELLPARSLSMAMSERRWGRGPWLIWQEDPDHHDEDDADEPPSLEDIVAAVRSPDAGVADDLSGADRAAYRVLQQAADVTEPKALEESLARELDVPMPVARRRVASLTTKLGARASQRGRTPPRPTFSSCVEWLPEGLLGKGKDRPALAKPFQWQNGKTITVAFMDGDPIVHERVEPIAKIWERFAKLDFKFIADPKLAHVRITFSRPGASSVLGTACEKIDRTEPTMVLGAINASTPPDEVYRLVLHEFGHAIGLIHEHQNPAGGIQWNKPVALAHYREQTGWDDEKIELNIFDAYAQDVTQFAFTAVDQTSIMMYPIPKELTLDGFEAGWNHNLSKTDIDFISKMYPGRLGGDPPKIPSAWTKPMTTTPVTPKTPEAPSNPETPTTSSPRPPAGRTAEQRRNEAFLQRLLARRPQDRAKYERRLNPPILEGHLEGLTDRGRLRVTELETIVRDERPVLFIRNGAFDTNDVAILGDEAQDLVDQLTAARSRVLPLLPLIGRINVENLSAGPWVGTGWFVDTDIVVTNRHVASLIARNDGRRFIFNRGVGGPIRASLGNGHLVDDESDTGESFPIIEVLYIERESGPNDIAFVRVARRTNGALPPFIPVAASDAGPNVAVCTIGYPAKAPKRIIPDQGLMKKLYRDRFDVKRVAPGYSVDTSDGVTEHDCTTLGGNSGSVVLDLATGAALGLHYAGIYREANFAVPASILREYIGRKRWNDPVEPEWPAVTPPPPPPPPQPPAPIGSAPPATTIIPGGQTAGTATLSFNLPITITVSIGTPQAQVQVQAQAQPVAPAVGQPVPKPATSIEDALVAYWDARPRGVVAARVGYSDRGDEIGDDPCLAVSVNPNELAAFQAGTASFLGYPIRYFPATAGEQIESRGILEAAVDRISYDDNARKGADFSFAQVKEEMEVLLHVGPEYSWDTLKNFLKGVKSELVSAIYEFHAPHIKDAIEERLEKGATFTLVADDTTFAKVHDEDEEFDRVEVFQRWNDRFGERFARIVPPEGATGLIANAYHIKVSVREDKTFWLSSGNWKMGSSQPVVTEEMRKNATEEDLPGNREWHVVIKNPTLADRFRNHILQDFARSEALGGGPLSKARARELEEELVVPIEESLVPERRAPSEILEPLSIRRLVKVRPLLTPDKEGAVYSEAVLDLIRSARSSLLFQIPYIGMSPNPRTDRGYIDALIAALVEQLLNLDDARVILRSGGSKLSSPAHTAWYFKSKGVDIKNRVRVIENHHTKGMIVDGKRTLIGSHNWSGPGVTLNRDASLIFDDKDVAEYYTRAFDIDWDRANAARALRFVKRPAGVRESVFGGTVAGGYERMTVADLLRED